ncbi:MAG: class I SAM-dependent methyltransferase [Acidobacteriota bacterium]
MREYDEIAGWFAAARSPEVGVADLAAFAEALPSEARVLDVGCGDGVPISRWLLREGFDLTALDSSGEMVRRYRTHFPEVPLHHLQVQGASFPPGSFDGVVAWGVLFHLAEADQGETLRRISTWLEPGGRLLFTAGDVRGTVESEMDGVTFRYISLGVDGYQSLLGEAGMVLERHDQDAWGNTVFFAAKTKDSAAVGRAPT